MYRWSKWPSQDQEPVHDRRGDLYESVTTAASILPPLSGAKDLCLKKSWSRSDFVTVLHKEEGEERSLRDQPVVK